MQLLESPSAAKEAEIAQDLAHEHAQALGDLASQSTGSPEDVQTLKDWTAEGQKLRTEARTKADEAILQNPVEVRSWDKSGVVDTKRDQAEIAGKRDQIAA